MARIRSIKPDYWKSEKLASRLPGPDGREARRLFVGLWNFAEDHGVVRGNAAYLRAELYPYDDDVTTADVERWLSLLERGDFIVRYQRDGSTYAWIRGFDEHQRISKPSKPTLPEPSEKERGLLRWHSATTPGVLPESSATPPVGLPVGGGDGREVEVEEEVEGCGEPSAADAASGDLFTGLKAPEAILEGAQPSRREQEQPPDTPRTEAPEALQRAWNENTSSPLPRWEGMDGRREAAKRALKRRPLSAWVEVFRRIEASPFCRGENDDGWMADCDWAIRPGGKKPEPATRVLEGRYDPRRPSPKANGTHPSTGGDPVCVTL